VQYEAFLADQHAETCSRCGTHPDDWIDPESGRRWSRPSWRAKATVCQGCAAVNDVKEEADARRSKDDVAALRIQLVQAVDEDDEDPDLHPG
jgi:hypothetical protein